ncbi:MAG: EamA family transporter [Defluviitaleaceae bacterium]|nr:EamA family transporter [Defluviitaleaceae bacterium]
MTKYRLYIVTAAILWGGTGVFFNELSALGAMPIQVAFLRAGFAAVALGLYLLIFNRKAFAIKLRDLWCFIGTGILSLLFFNWSFFSAINETGIAVAAVLLYTAPAFVTVLSMPLFKESPGKLGIVVLVMTLAGCALVSGILGVTSVSAAGLLFGLGAGFGYALYTIFGRYALNRGYSPFTISFYTFALAAIGSVPFVAQTSMPHAVALPQFWLLALGLGTLGCLLPYWLYTKGLAGVTGAVASMTATIEPAVSIMFGIVLYREVVDLPQWVGVALILFGVVLLSWGRQRDVQN